MLARGSDEVAVGVGSEVDLGVAKPFGHDGDVYSGGELQAG